MHGTYILQTKWLLPLYSIRMNDLDFTWWFLREEENARMHCHSRIRNYEDREINR